MKKKRGGRGRKKEEREEKMERRERQADTEGTGRGREERGHDTTAPAATLGHAGRDGEKRRGPVSGVEGRVPGQRWVRSLPIQRKIYI